MNRPEPEWYTEARRLRAEGMLIKKISETLGHANSTVRIALDKNGAREKKLEKNRREHKMNRKMATEQPVILPTQAFVEPRKAGSPPRKIINRDAIALILKQRRGNIPIAELMEMITL